MGIEYLFIVRLSDGLVLAASTESSTQAVTLQPPSTSSATAAQGLRARGAAATSGGGQGPTGKDLREGRDLLLQLNNSSPPRCSVDGEALTYHYAISGPLVCFVATDKQ